MLGLTPKPFTIRLVEKYDTGERCICCGNKLNIYTHEDGLPYHWETDHSPLCIARQIYFGSG